MARLRQDKAQRIWERIEALGGHGVWEPDMVVVSLAGTGVTDDDLALFEEFPQVQILDLSETGVGDDGLDHLANLPTLELLILVNTKVSAARIDRFRATYLNIQVKTQPTPRNAINPFTVKPCYEVSEDQDRS